MKISKSELKQIIKEEAERFVKIKALETQKENIKNQINEMYSESITEIVAEEEVVAEEVVAEEFVTEEDSPEVTPEVVPEVSSPISESIIRKIVREEAERSSKVKTLSERAKAILSEMNEMGYSMEEMVDEMDYNMEGDMMDEMDYNMEEDMMDEISLNPFKKKDATATDSSFKDANDYLAKDPQAATVKAQYLKAKASGDMKFLGGLNRYLMNWSVKNLGYDEKSGITFARDVYKVIDGAEQSAFHGGSSRGGSTAE